MSTLLSALISRFGESAITEIQGKEGELPLIHLKLDLKSPVTILMTNGLSSYEMPVPEKVKGREFIELYFCLPSYWDLADTDNPNTNWVFPWIQRLAKHVFDKQTWYGHGHSMPCGADKKPLSGLMKQNHFFLVDPILLEEELSPLELGDKTIYFLAIIPIFKDELDFKVARGTFKLLEIFNLKGVNEKLDDFRLTSLRGKWKLFRFLKKS